MTNSVCPNRWRAASRLLRVGLVTHLLGAFSALPAAGAEGGITDQPLAPHRSAPGKTMFAELPAEETGIRTENNFADPRMKGDLYQEFETGSVGTGVAIGDYDGDGRPDIFVVSKTESCRLFRNLGDWKFEDVSEKAGVLNRGDAAKIWKSGVTFVDVNNDGRLDLYVCRYNAPNLFYLNQGDGTFREMAREHGLDIKDSSVMAAFADWDRDGWLDVYIATNILDIAKFPNGQRGIFLHNNGNGTFSDVSERAGVAGERQSHSATWWDYNNDGWPDLYVAYDYGSPDNLYRNNRNGTFTDGLNAALPHTSFSSMGADVGDVNNDGLIDFFVADMAGTTHAKDHHMTADFRARTQPLPDGSPIAPKYHRNALLLNTGTGLALEGAFLAGIAASDWTWSPRFADLDNDGRLDLFITNGFPRDPSVDVVKRIQSAETPAERVKIMYASPQLNEIHHAFRNRGDLEFEPVGPKWGLDHKGVSFGTAFGDLGGDGNLAIVYGSYRRGATVLRNDNDTGHRIVVDLRGTVSNRFGIGAMVRIESALGTQASQLWLGRGYMSSSEPAVHFGLGNDTTIDRMVVTWPSGQVQTFTDLPVDRRFTVTEPSGPADLSKPWMPSPPAPQFSEISEAAGLVVHSQEELIDETAAQRLLPIQLNRRGPALAAGPLGGGAEAVVVGGTTVTRASVLVRSDEHKFAATDTSAVLPVGPVDDGPVLLFDADGDGHQDLLVTRGGNAQPVGAPEYQPKLLLGDGNGGFQSAAEGVLPEIVMSVGAVAAADFNHSGRLGLFIGGRVSTGDYPLAPPSVLLANRGGKFEDVTDALAPALREVGMVTSALWSDVDDDGWVDLLLTLDWGTVKYFHNNAGQGFVDRSESAGFSSAGTGWWTSIAGADFNGDGRPDYVVGNVGLNTQYRADPQHPALLYSGDFKGDGSTQLVEAYYEGEKVYPWRILRDLGAAIPSILKRYPRWDQYENKTLGEILGEDKLAKALRFAATEFRHGVFLSQPDGTYRFDPLPRIAQISPFQGLVAGDFDGDGFADIYAVQNSYAPITLVGRFDGGLSQLLRGDGQGRFNPATPLESGLLVTGDAKALVVLDLDRDGWPDFLTSRNYGATLAFRNNGVPGRRSLCVQLQGPAGNPTGVGARITCELANGSPQTAEVHAGSGFYSQSSAACFFGLGGTTEPVRLRIRWPSGATTEHSVDANVGTITIPSPAP